MDPPPPPSFPGMFQRLSGMTQGSSHVSDASSDVPTLPLYPDTKANRDPTASQYNKAQATVSTPVDVMMSPSATDVIIDVAGLKSGDIKVQVVEDNVLVISGERRREEVKEAASKYVTTERSVGKFMRKFVLPHNANTETISAVCEDGVLTVTVQKLPPPEPRKEAKNIEVKMGKAQAQAMASTPLDVKMHPAATAIMMYTKKNRTIMADYSSNI